MLCVSGQIKKPGLRMLGHFMCISDYNKKIFGVALDPADDPWTLQLKQEWMAADTTLLDPLSAFLDPYDAVTESMKTTLEGRHIRKAGKVPVPSWLWPKPKRDDLPYVTAHNMAGFFENDGLAEIVREIRSFVKKDVFPDIPIMLGIDHSATAGVISALAERYSPETLGVVVLDQHFDAIPLSVRLEGAVQAGTIPSQTPVPVGFSDHFCCGNFWSHLIDEGILLPQNLLFVGVTDYPKIEDDPQKNSYRDAYLEFEARGCRFFPKRYFDGPYKDALFSFLRDNIHTSNVYVSLDLDVGAFSGTYAARYMERPGISKENVLDVALLITEACRQGNFKIAGMDVMEFNMHFLGIETPDGTKDRTLDLVVEFLTALT
jgi:arginase family enzyme